MHRIICKYFNFKASYGGYNFPQYIYQLSALITSVLLYLELRESIYYNVDEAVIGSRVLFSMIGAQIWIACRYALDLDP